jgi:Ni,Fe-hydrogenase I small subunit
MAITRRQFVTRLGTLAAAVGMSSSQVSKIVETFAFDAGGTNLGGTLGKPRVVWIHGAECTGCSTSLLGIFENTGGKAVEGMSLTTGEAAGMAGILPTQLGGNDFTLHATGYNVEGYGGAMNIADVVVDVIDLQYHETVMGMGGDLAAQWLEDFRNYVPTPGGSNPGDAPFVLVVEGALQDRMGGGAWGDTSDTDVPWCSIGMSKDYEHGGPGFEHDMSEAVVDLATKATCAAVIPIGQCATFGGYPGCKPPISEATAGFDPTQSQTGAMGVYDYLVGHGEEDAANKVINVPGCPTNPWWFTLTVVMFLVDLVNPSRPLGVLTPAGLPNAAAIDGDRRLTAVYGTPIHGPYCPRYRDYVIGEFASKPGDPGCLQKIGCKGPATNSLCGMHGWNNQQPQNPDGWNYGVPTVNTAPNGQKTGGHCTCAGHPCMACTEKGYPDAFVPFISRS